MKKHRALFCLFTVLALAACGELGILNEPYHYNVKKITAGEYRITFNSDYEVGEDALKQYLKSRGTKLCGDKVYLLRDVKSTHLDAEKSYVITADIDCVPLNYFR